MANEYEVAILGSSISGTLLAAVLARHRVRVGVFDGGTHPRFAIGEATVPETTTHLRIMAQLFDVPEIERMASFFELRDGVGSSHGIKRGFSFCHHRERRPHLPAESNQTATLSPPFGPDSHWFRQDTDQYMLNVAAHYGAEVHQATAIKDFTVHSDGLMLSSDRGDFHAQFVVDAAGSASPFGKKMKIRDTTTRLATQSRGIFTHMVGVGSWDALVGFESHGMPYRMDQTTLHHYFDGGWMWVIPFNNHQQATNPLCSVGVMFDCTKHPQAGRPASEEFAAFLARYPTIAEQFKAARATRDWVSSPRIQYSSSRLAANRYFALPHAAVFIDPLFSTGLNLTAHAVNVLGEILIDSFEQGQVDSERLGALEARILEKASVYDRLVATSFKAFRSFALWNAWYRVWEIGAYFNTLGAMKCLLAHAESGDRAHLRARFGEPYGAPLGFGVEGYAQLFEAAVAAVERVDRGDCEEAAGLQAIYAALDAFDALPAFLARRDPKDRTAGALTVDRLLHAFVWGKTRAPLHTRHYYDVSLVSAARGMLPVLASYVSRHAGVGRQPISDMFFSRTRNGPRPDPSFGARIPARSLKSPSGERGEATNGGAAPRPIARA